jgi:hypothetical protein
MFGYLVSGEQIDSGCHDFADAASGLANQAQGFRVSRVGTRR